MKVYVVVLYYGHYESEGCEIIGVCSTLENAEKMRNSQKIYNQEIILINEYEMDKIIVGDDENMIEQW